MLVWLRAVAMAEPIVLEALAQAKAGKEDLRLEDFKDMDIDVATLTRGFGKKSGARAVH